MIKNLITNYKTTSAGAVMIIGSVIHLIFAIRAGNATEGVWTASVTAIVAGIGLILAGDGSASLQQTAQLKADVKTAIDTKDTTILTKPQDPPAPPKP